MYTILKSLEHNYYDIESYLILKQIPTPLLEKICRHVFLYIYQYEENKPLTQQLQVPLEDSDYYYVLSSYMNQDPECCLLTITPKHVELLKKCSIYYLTKYGNVIFY